MSVCMPEYTHNSVSKHRKDYTSYTHVFTAGTRTMWLQKLCSWSSRRWLLHTILRAHVCSLVHIANVAVLCT